MINLLGLEQLKTRPEVGALCIGSFDGVHLGHRKLVESTLEESKKTGGESTAVSFSPHPRELFQDTNFQRIYPSHQNKKILQRLGVKNVFFIDFTHETASLKAQDFLKDLYSQLKFKSLVIGFDFKLGAGRSGDSDYIKKWCDSKGVHFKEVLEVKHQNSKISSSLIREILQKGDFEEAKKLLGDSYTLTGEPYQDQGLGKRMGFPTLNVEIPQNLVLPNGVYAVKAKWQTESVKAIANIGVRPTVMEDSSTTKRVLEVHILDKAINEPILEINVSFCSYLRPEKKFSSMEELKSQISLDIQKVKKEFLS